MNNYDSTIGRRIKAARQKKGYNQEKLAELIGVSTGSVGGYETSKSYPSFDVIMKISEACDVSIDWFGKGDKVMNDVLYEVRAESNKPADQGTFGSQVEQSLREENRYLKSQLESAMAIIKNLSLGKDEVMAGAAKLAGVTKEVSLRCFAAMTGQPNAVPTA